MKAEFKVFIRKDWNTNGLEAYVSDKTTGQGEQIRPVTIIVDEESVIKSAEILLARRNSELLAKNSKALYDAQFKTKGKK